MSINTNLGKTPLVELEEWRGSRLLLKLEGENGSGSVKSRLVYFLIDEAIVRGDLVPGKKIVEVSSGNTGVALAMAGRELGYGVEIILSEDADRSLVQKIGRYGAVPLLLPRQESLERALALAEAKVQTGQYWWPDQFHNPSAPLAYHALAGELVQQAGSVDVLVAAVGTGGTLRGVGEKLKELCPGVKLVAIEADPCQPVPGIRLAGQSLGCGDVYISGAPIGFPDRTIYVTRQQASEGLRALESHRLVGSESSGAVFSVGLQLCSEGASARIALILADAKRRGGVAGE